MNSSMRRTLLREYSFAQQMAFSKPSQLSSIVTPLLPEESVGLTTRGKVKSLAFSLISLIGVLGWKDWCFGQAKPFVCRNSRQGYFNPRISTLFAGFVGNPRRSATIAAGRAAGSDAYASMPSTFSSFAIR